jgi:hypothetical protein
MSELLNITSEFLTKKGFTINGNEAMLEKDGIELIAQIYNGFGEHLMLRINREGANKKKLHGLLRTVLPAFDLVEGRHVTEADDLQPYKLREVFDNVLHVVHSGSKIDLFSRYNGEFLPTYIHIMSRYRTDFMKSLNKKSVIESGDSSEFNYCLYNEGEKDFILINKFDKKKTKSAKIASEGIGMDQTKFIKRVSGATFELLTDEKDISTAYADRAVDSCMNKLSEKCAKFYCSINEFVGLAVLQSEKLKARALVWQLGEKEIYVDRIYPSDSNRPEFIKLKADIKEHYADSGLTVKFRSNTGMERPTSVTGRKVTWGASAAPKMLPYMDTFKSMQLENDELVFYNSSDNDFYLESTSGGCAGEYGTGKSTFSRCSLSTFKERVKMKALDGKILALTAVRITQSGLKPVITAYSHDRMPMNKKGLVKLDKVINGCYLYISADTAQFLENLGLLKDYLNEEG